MGSDLILVARTDAEAANLLDTNIDPRDHVFILGSSNSDLLPLADLIRLATEKRERRENPLGHQVKLKALSAKFPEIAAQVAAVWKQQDAATDMRNSTGAHGSQSTENQFAKH
jgi:isocitrate lyase